MATTQFRTTQLKHSEAATVDFGTNVINAGAAVQGFSLEFGDDHHIKAIGAKALITSISGSIVTVTGVCLMEDNSGHVAKGTLDVVVTAYCE